MDEGEEVVTWMRQHLSIELMPWQEKLVKDLLRNCVSGNLSAEGDTPLPLSQTGD